MFQIQTLFNRNCKIIIFSLIFISLFFTFTNYIPLSVSFAPLILIIPLIINKQKTIPSVILWVGFVLLYFLLWTLIYSPEALVNFYFYRRDGNVFATLMPLLLLGTFSFRFDMNKIIKRFFYFVTIINLLALPTYFLGITKDNEVDGCYCFLFLTHNAAGGFLANLAALSFAIWIKEKNFIHASFALFNAFTLYLSHSRGSILALLMAIAMHFWLKERHVKKIVAVSIISTLVLISFTYPMWLEMGKVKSFLAQEEINHESASLNMERSYTFVDRALFLWPRAFDLWLQSPIFGTGYGSYNDLPYYLEGIPYIAMMNRPLSYEYSDSHAHHTFFHILSETGLVGLILVIMMLVVMRKFILSLNDGIERTALVLMFWVSVWSSMTEHRLFTPSQMLPFTLLLGLCIGNARTMYSHELKLKAL